MDNAIFLSKILNISISVINISKIFLILIFFATSANSEDNLKNIKLQLDRLGKDLSDLQLHVYNSSESNFSEKKIETSQLSVFDIRLRDIESELKAINLNYENIIFEIDNLKKMFEEINLKYNTLIINENEQTKKETKENENIDTLEDGTETSPNTLGTLKINSEDLSEAGKNEAQANEISDSQKENLSPDEQFQLAFNNLRSQKFDEAEISLKKFISDFPDNNLSGSAYYWLGEMYLLKKQNREAALTFAEGYQKYPESIKAPDTLYKLADVLIKIDKNIEGCDTYKQFLLKYPNHKLSNKTEIKVEKNNCT